MRPFPARLERTVSEETRMLPAKQQSTATSDGGVLVAAEETAPLPLDKAVAANAV